MTLIISIVLGLVFVFVVGVMALGIAAYGRDYCDETIDQAGQADPKNQRFSGAPGEGQKEAIEAKEAKGARPGDNAGGHENPPLQDTQNSEPRGQKVRRRDARGRFVKEKPNKTEENKGNGKD